jgi:CheY-like chemotaxis protein
VIDKGSIFSFTVPFEVWAQGAIGAAEPVGAGVELPLPALRILLAEDSPDNCIITMAYLEDTPYRVDIADTGAVACEMFAVGNYDLVLMDRQMPVMDGLTATRKIRTWERANQRRPTPIIALTASALKGDREKCLAAGCTAFLTKPIKQAVLLQAIKECAPGRSPATREAGPRPAPSLVHTYPTLAARVPAFLQNRKNDVVIILAALLRGEFELVERLAHSMSGAGASFGFQTISDIGRALETAARAEDLQASQLQVEELSSYLERVDQTPTEPSPPVATPSAPPASLSADAPPKAVPVHRPRVILLVEDDEDMRTMFREILEYRGHQVREASDGIEAEAMILLEKPDVAIIDIGLIGIDGYELARRIRTALGDSLRLVAMTGRATESDRLQALAAGFDAHMTKPFDNDRMEEMLGAALPAIGLQ